MFVICKDLSLTASGSRACSQLSKVETVLLFYCPSSLLLMDENKNDNTLSVDRVNLA